MMNFQRTRTAICLLLGHRNWVDGFRIEGPPSDSGSRRSEEVAICTFCDRVEPVRVLEEF